MDLEYIFNPVYSETSAINSVRNLLFLYKKELGKTWEDIQNEKEEEEESKTDQSNPEEEWVEI